MSLLGRWASRTAVPASTLMLGDCFDRMREIPDASVDMVLCDLPYGTTACAWDSVLSVDMLWREYMRVVSDRGAIVLTATQPFASVLVSSNIKYFKYEWVWNKTRITDFVRAKLKPMTGHENVLVFSKGTVTNGSDKLMTYNPIGLRRVDKKAKNGKVAVQLGTATSIGPNNKLLQASYIQEFEGYPNTKLEFQSVQNTVHPTQKPVPLFEYLVRTYTNVGATVLDNCMGSGTTGVACANSGRRFIGIERDKDYFAIAERRIREAEGAARERGGVIL